MHAIIGLAALCVGASAAPVSGKDPAKDAGDVVPEGVAWARYPDGYDVWLGHGSTKQVGEDELILGKTW